MTDIETLGTTPGYIVVSIGIVPFEYEEETEFDELLKYGTRIHFNIQEQYDKGLKISLDTLDWWFSQSDGAIKKTFVETNRLPLEDALKKVAGIFSIANKVWTFGYMDIAMINALYDSVGLPAGIFYRNHMDMRTVAQFCSGDWPDKPKGFIGHDALHDAAYQAYVLQRITK